MTLDRDALNSLRIDRSDRARHDRVDRKRWLLVACGVLVLALLGFFLLRDVRPIVTVVTIEAARGGRGGAGGSAVLNASGYVVARRVATVSSKVTGRIGEVLIEEGSVVSEGQVLARVEAGMARSEAELAERQRDASAGNAEEVVIRLAEAERNLARVRSLREQALTSVGALDSAEAEAKALRARLSAARSQLGAANSSVALRRRDLADHEVRAPFAGVVISKDAQPGEIVSPVSAGGGFTRTGIATIVDMDSREIEVDVNEAFINRVAADQRVEATLDAYPDWTIAARVINIVPTADRTKATVRVRIGFEALDSRILPDMGIKVRFLEQVAPAAPTDKPSAALPQVPSAALVGSGDSAYVWILAKGKVERRAITAGAERDGQVEISAGLRAGDQIVASAVEGLADGVRVKIAEQQISEQ